ncbi:hypothetical protein [Flammeovirga agarivorans]|uniref:Lipoprotein n=1 Tax=Flammeovirga agarivorans TaxID=2726742 RepID=A0A7X8SKX0_9BACT|nr:hypothetical protein [Flammeovirga agarivorans]NLR92139.1 hypothetical protein [Flammeovirga agarivorans]
MKKILIYIVSLLLVSCGSGGNEPTPLDVFYQTVNQDNNRQEILTKELSFYSGGGYEYRSQIIDFNSNIISTEIISGDSLSQVEDNGIINYTFSGMMFNCTDSLEGEYTRSMILNPVKYEGFTIHCD